MIEEVLAHFRLEARIPESKTIPLVGEAARSNDGYPCLVTHVERIESQMGFPYYVIAGVVTISCSKTQVVWMLRPAEEIEEAKEQEECEA